MDDIPGSFEAVDRRNAAQLRRQVGLALSQHGLRKHGSRWYQAHEVMTWVISTRRLFGGAQLAVDVGVAFRAFGQLAWPADRDCQLQTSYERLGDGLPPGVDSTQWGSRDSFFGVVLNALDIRMSPTLRDTAIDFLAEELSSLAAATGTLRALSELISRPTAGKPLMDKRVKVLLAEGSPPN